LIRQTKTARERAQLKSIIAPNSYVNIFSARAKKEKKLSSIICIQDETPHPSVLIFCLPQYGRCPDIV
jgi:hypothetical protein